MKPINIRKAIAYTLSIFVLLFSFLAILSVWDIIDYNFLMKRMFQSLIVVLVAAAVIVLIFAIMVKEDRHEDQPPR
ncbi:MAG: hypothetical protein ACOYXB_15215 [Bacteroidota bacterium]